MSVLLLIPWFRWEPFLVELGGHERSIYPYQVTVALAIVAIISTAVAFTAKQGRSVENTLDFILYVMLGALPAAVLASLALDDPGEFGRLLDEPSRALDLRLHWSTLGGLMGGLAGALLWRHRARGSLLEMLDVLAFSLPFGWWIARVGCFGVHDHAGRVSSFALAVADFRFGSPPYQPRHDMALYDAIVVGAIAILFALLSRRPRRTGFYLGLLLVLYTPIRFGLDFLRASEADGGMARHLGLTHIQFVALALFLVGLLAMRRVRSSGAS